MIEKLNIINSINSIFSGKNTGAFSWKNIFWSVFAAAAVFCLNLIVFSRIGLLDFNRIDHGFMLETVWRVMNGQRIYEDFVFHTGPVHVYLDVLFFKLFGLGRTAMLVHMAAINTIVAGLTFFAAWRRIPVFFAVICTYLTLAGFYWAYPHPYYDYTAHLLGLIAIAGLAQTIPFNSKRQALIAGFIGGAAAMLSCLTKINVGAAYFGICGAVLLTCRNLRYSLPAYLASALAVLGVLFLFVSPSAFFANHFEYHSVVSPRLMRFVLILIYFKNFFWLPFVLLYIATIGKRLAYLPQLALCLGLGVVAIFTVNTGSYRGWNYLPMMGMYAALTFRVLFSIYGEAYFRKKKIMVGIFIGILTATVFYQSYQLWTLFYPQYRKAHADNPYVLKNGPFRGWRFPEEKGKNLDAMIEAVQKLPANEELLVLSQAQMVYIFAKKKSYSFKGMVVQWYPGSDPVPSRRGEAAQYIINHPPEWILISIDGVHPVNDIVEYLGIPLPFFQQYQVVQTWGADGLMKRRY